MALLDPPPETKYNVLSLGAGVQSSCLALMAEHGEIKPKPDLAIFADTQGEPEEVYNWLQYLKEKLSYPVVTVTKGNLVDACLETHFIKKEDAKLPVNTPYVLNLIPAFAHYENTGNTKLAIGRLCTKHYKIDPIYKYLKQRFNIKRGEKLPQVTQWIGISWDEVMRMKESKVPWAQHRHPLIEIKMRRGECLEWMKKNGYPEPPRSACWFCPFRHNSEWRNLRDNYPSEFKKAIQFDKDLRDHYKNIDSKRPTKYDERAVFIHSSCQPLGEIDFDDDADKGQGTFDFSSECEGMCGV